MQHRYKHVYFSLVITLSMIRTCVVATGLGERERVPLMVNLVSP